jgi:N-carbamoylputrescine amidase
MKERGAQILVSSAAWPPGKCGPGRVWEERSRETGLTLIVCNRTGDEPMMSLKDADSVIARDGKRMLGFHSAKPAILIADLNRRTLAPVSAQFSVTTLDAEVIR